LLTSIVISPEADGTGELSANLSELGHVRVLRTFQQYPSDEELDRFLHIAGPSIVFLGTENIRRALELALAIDRAGTGTQVVALSSAREPQVLVECMQVGIREFLSLPLDPDRVYQTVCRITDVLERKPLAFKSTDAVFGFLPAKPGDGASTVAVNVSSAIARRSSGKTLLADFDLNLGMVAFLLKITNGHAILNAIDVAERMDDALWNNLVLNRDNLDVLCSGKLEPRSDIDPSLAEKVLHFARRSYSSICIDLSGSMEPFSLALLAQCREIFLVCTSDVPSLHFARAKVQLLRESRLLDRASVVINRSAIRSPFSIDDMEKVLGLRLRLSLQNDPRRVSNAMREGTYVDPKSGLGRQFETLAASLVGLDSPSTTVSRKRRFIEHFAIVPSDLASEKKRC
jgi:pilus assembly protein CpaE